MVNVNKPVSSSMELPFGEYTFLCFYPFGFSEKKGRVWQLLASSLCSLVCAAAVCLQSSTDLQWKYHRHLCLPFSHGCNPGGVSEIWRLLKKAMGAGPDGDDGTEGLRCQKSSSTSSLKRFTGGFNRIQTWCCWCS